MAFPKVVHKFNYFFQETLKSYYFQSLVMFYDTQMKDPGDNQNQQRLNLDFGVTTLIYCHF